MSVYTLETMPLRGSSFQLTPGEVLRGYRAGAFPMAHGPRGAIAWFSPDPRALLPLEPGAFHVPRSLGRRVRSERFEVTFDRAFEQVIRACAAPRRGESETWISNAIIDAYTALHHMGMAHSVEAWARPGEHAGKAAASEDAGTGARSRNTAAEPEAEGPPELVGGLYGVALGGAFFGESMFTRQPDASKVCLVKLVEHLRRRGFVLLDAQFHNPHLEQFGPYEVPRRTYLRRLREALALEVNW